MHFLVTFQNDCGAPEIASILFWCRRDCDNIFFQVADSLAVPDFGAKSWQSAKLPVYGPTEPFASVPPPLSPSDAV